MRRVSIVIFVLLAAVIAISCGQKVEEDPALLAFRASLADEAQIAATESKIVLMDFFTDW